MLHHRTLIALFLALIVLPLGANLADGRGSITTDAVQKILGRAPRSFDEFARDHAARCAHCGEPRLRHIREQRRGRAPWARATPMAR